MWAAAIRAINRNDDEIMMLHTVIAYVLMFCVLEKNVYVHVASNVLTLI
jgi:hypothetical protein